MKCRKTTVACKNCSLYDVGVILGLESKAATKPFALDDFLSKAYFVKKETRICQAQQQSPYLYVVQTGTCVSYKMVNGEEQITSFHFAGELFGIDALMEAKYNYNIRALEDSHLCRLDLNQLKKQLDAQNLLAVQQYLLQSLTHYSQSLQTETALMGAQVAEQRLALFLLNMGKRFQTRGLPADSFYLPMSRADIASYLGLAVETVIRSLRKLHHLGLLEIKAKQIRFPNPSALNDFSQSAK